MALTYCHACRSIEGGTTEIEVDGEEIVVCEECGSEELGGLAEHDDYDWER